MAKIQSFNNVVPDGFTIIQPDAGTSPTADGPNDTLTLTSSDGSVLITGNSTTDTVDFRITGSVGSTVSFGGLFVTGLTPPGVVVSGTSGLLSSVTPLGITLGGIGTTFFTANNILLGNGSTSINTTPILGVTLGGSGTTALVSLPYGITLGGIGTTTFATNTLLGGNGSTSIITYALPLGVTLGGSGQTAIPFGITLGGIGTTTFATNTLLGGNGSTSILAYPAPLGVTFGGTGTTAVPFGVTLGGTGSTTFTANGVLLGNGSTSIAVSAAGSANQVFRVPAAGNPPSFGAVLLSSVGVTGILGIPNGGTGTTAIPFGVTLGGTGVTIGPIGFTLGGVGTTAPPLGITIGGIGASTFAVNTILGGNGSTSILAYPLPLGVTLGGVGGNTFTQGSVIFAGSGGALTQDNADFNYNSTTNNLIVAGKVRLGSGSVPSAMIDASILAATDVGIKFTGAASQSANYVTINDSAASEVASLSSAGTLNLLGNQTFTKEVAHTIGIANSTTSGAVGATLTIQGAGATSGNANGGAVIITTGGGNSLGSGGNLLIQTASGGGVAPGNITILSNTTFSSGTITIENGAVTSANNVGDITIATGTLATGTGGDILLTCGAASGAGTGGNITLTAGNTSGGTNGVITLVSGGANALLTTTSSNITISKKITSYNSKTTAGNGVPSILATVDLVNQQAAIAATTIHTPSTNGHYRLSAYIQVTRVSSTSSTLGGATGIVITWTDVDVGAAQSVTMATQNAAGAIATGDAGNTLTTVLLGQINFRASASNQIKYAIGYTSAGVVPMRYCVNLKLEQLGD